MRLGLFGGTFDPVHSGHLLLAESCREQCKLDEVWFLPAAQSPHKQSSPPADARQRIEMLELAIAGHESFRTCDLEIRRGGVSFTADTLAELARRQTDAELFFLMGADSLEDLPRWHQPADICTLAVPVVVSRTGSPEPDFGCLADVIPPGRIDEIRQSQVVMPRIELSSTDIRQRVAAGQSICYRTPKAVEMYISTHGLYQ